LFLVPRFFNEGKTHEYLEHGGFHRVAGIVLDHVGQTEAIACVEVHSLAAELDSRDETEIAADAELRVIVVRETAETAPPLMLR
jgi:hypothetical protein